MQWKIHFDFRSCIWICDRGGDYWAEMEEWQIPFEVNIIVVYILLTIDDAMNGFPTGETETAVSVSFHLSKR